MISTLSPTPATVHGAVSSAFSPVLWIESGERVNVETVDVGFGLAAPVDPVSPRKRVLPAVPERADGPGCVGPIGVRGAEPGMFLAVTLEQVVPAGEGFTYLGGGFPTALAEELGIANAAPGLVRWQIDVERGTAIADAGWGVPIRPFLGTIGLAPHSTATVSGWAPRPTGGNMDCRELVAGSTIYLPVEAAGGLLSLGDGHAAQGDGEVGGMAIECRMESVVLVIDLVTSPPGWFGNHVHADTPAGAVVFGFDESLDRAMKSAVRRMTDLIVDRCRVDVPTALVLASACADFRVTQVVNGVVGVHGVLPHDALREAASEQKSYGIAR